VPAERSRSTRCPSFAGWAGAPAAGSSSWSPALYGIEASDPLVLGAVTAALGLVALLACALPARRAARIDPVVALSE